MTDAGAGPTPGSTFDNGKVRLEVLASTAEEFVLRATHAPDSPYPPAHFHPSQTETFTVEEGTLRFVLNDRSIDAAAGDVVEVPPGVVHRVRNATDQVAVVHWRTSPALRTGHFHACIHHAMADGDGPALGRCLEECRDVFRRAPARLPARCSGERGHHAPL